jgi:hypothetical protein
VDNASFHFEGITEFEGALNALIVRMDLATNAGLTEGGQVVESYAKMGASGAPGPNVITGTLRRSIHVEGPSSYGNAGRQIQIGPSVIYGRRVELGFHGDDSLGRHYEQDGKPYLGPALDRVRNTLLPSIFERAWAAALIA